MSQAHVWTIDIAFTEDGDHTRADAVLDLGAAHYHGWGRAKRNPHDPDVPRVGEELAAARALEDLVGKLLHAAEEDVESFEGHHVNLHV